MGRQPGDRAIGRAPRAASEVGSLGGLAKIIVADLATTDGIESAAERLRDIDVGVRVNNAGIGAHERGRGLVVNVASILGFMPTPYFATYAATSPIGAAYRLLAFLVAITPRAIMRRIMGRIFAPPQISAGATRARAVQGDGKWRGGAL